MLHFFVLPRFAGIGLILMIATPELPARDEITLAEVERLALEQAPWLKHHHRNSEAAADRVVYESRLPDPQLTLGLVNVPRDSLRLDREDMTMAMVGVRQSFPPGEVLKLKAQRAERDYNREQARADLEVRNLLRQVRLTWVELYFQQESLKTLEAIRRLAEKQLEAAQASYRAAQTTQQTVLKAQQIVARQKERAPMVHAQASRLQAQLARWIGEAAYRALPSDFPVLPTAAEAFDHSQHPEWIIAQHGFEQARVEVAMAREEYKPGWMLDVSYGFRRSTPNGMDRPDMVSAMITLDMPIFREKRQDRRLAEKLALESGSRYELEDKRRELEAMHRAVRAEFDALTERESIFTRELLPATRRESQVTAAGFARDQTEYREALMKTLETELEHKRLRTELAKAQAELLYLSGEVQP